MNNQQLSKIVGLDFAMLGKQMYVAHDLIHWLLDYDCGKHAELIHVIPLGLIQ
jgi:hypothetical protein